MQWQFFPRTSPTPEFLHETLRVFEEAHPDISSADRDNDDRMGSNDVLERLRHDLKELGYLVEVGKKSQDKIRVPVLFGSEGKVDKGFDADAWNKETKTVIEVEAGRAWANNQFLKDIFQASVMDEVEYLVIAVRSVYRGKRDFDEISKWLEIIYLTNRIELDLKGILLVGY